MLDTCDSGGTLFRRHSVLLFSDSVLANCQEKMST